MEELIMNFMNFIDFIASNRRIFEGLVIFLMIPIIFSKNLDKKWIKRRIKLFMVLILMVFTLFTITNFIKSLLFINFTSEEIDKIVPALVFPMMALFMVLMTIFDKIFIFLNRDFEEENCSK